MKKLVLLLSCALMSCAEGIEVQKRELPVKMNGSSVSNVLVVEIDGCEYLYVPGGSATWGTHKGNCRNPFHFQENNQ